MSSDHRIVTAKICLSLRRNTIQTTKITHYDWPKLSATRGRFVSLLEINFYHIHMYTHIYVHMEVNNGVKSDTIEKK